MCGIVGLVNGHPVARDLVAALGRLAYRGYDSAGVAVAGPGFAVHKVVGCARDLSAAIAPAMPQGRAGIGHTRWATHGRAEARNAHPHRAGGIAVVHNGIIAEAEPDRILVARQGSPLVVGEGHESAAVASGRDVDRPRNLARSVTVE